jgi:hypothetical protein
MSQSTITHFRVLLTLLAELQLAMAFIPPRLFLRILGLRLHGLLLCHATAHHRFRQHFTLLLLRGSRMRCLRATNGDRWLLDGVRIREKDLWRNQSRLMSGIRMFGVLGQSAITAPGIWKGDNISLLFGLDAQLARTNAIHYSQRCRSARTRHTIFSFYPKKLLRDRDLDIAVGD